MTSAPDGLRPEYPVRTARLDLRPHRREDLEDLLAFHSQPAVVRYIPWPVRDREQTAAALETKLDQSTLTEPGQWLVLAAELRATSTVIGEVLLKWSSATERVGELGFAFHAEHHGRGLAAEAARAVLRLGFEELGLARIEAVCVGENSSSIRLLGRLGLQLETQRTDRVMFKGEWVHQLTFSMSSDDWRVAADRAAIDSLVATFFAAFTSGPGCDERLDALRAVFVPGAVIVRTCGQEPVVYDVEGFIAPRRALLTDGTLTEFSEWKVDGHTELFGDIAHHFCRYAKAGVQDGGEFTGHGMKSLQFVRLSAGWRISAAAWDDEREGLILPQLLPLLPRYGHSRVGT